MIGQLHTTLSALGSLLQPYALHVYVAFTVYLIYIGREIKTPRKSEKVWTKSLKSSFARIGIALSVMGVILGVIAQSETKSTSSLLIR